MCLGVLLLSCFSWFWWFYFGFVSSFFSVIPPTTVFASCDFSLFHSRRCNDSFSVFHFVSLLSFPCASWTVYILREEQEGQEIQTERKEKKEDGKSFILLPSTSCVSYSLVFSLSHNSLCLHVSLILSVSCDSWFFFSKKVHKTLLQRLIYQHFFLPTEQSSRTFGSVPKEWCLTLSWHGFVSWGQRPF